MFLDSYFDNSWGSNNDFNTNDFSQDFSDQAKLINEFLQSLTAQNLEAINTAKNTIMVDLGIVFKQSSQISDSLKNAINNYSNKVNNATLKFYNRYAGIHNATYTPGMSTLGGDTRIDYDGNAVAFIDSMLEAFDELTTELNGFGFEIENETGNLLETLNETLNEFQQNTENALTNAENDISTNGIATQSLIATANTTFQQKITADFASSLSRATNKWMSSVGSSGGGGSSGFVLELLGQVLDFGSFF